MVSRLYVVAVFLSSNLCTSLTLKSDMLTNHNVPIRDGNHFLNKHKNLAILSSYLKTLEANLF